MAEVSPLGMEGDRERSLDRMVSIRLHVAEESPALSQAGEVTTNFKRWVSTDALGMQSNGITEMAAREFLPSSAASLGVSNGIPLGNGVKKERGDQVLTNISENGAVLNNKAGRKPVKKRWRIKRIFGIKKN